MPLRTDASAADRWRDAQRILCVRLDAMGDVLMTTPAIRALAEAGRDREITLLTSRSGAEAARLIPEIRHILIYEAPWMKASAIRSPGLYHRTMIERLKAQGFHAAVIFTTYSQSALPAALHCYLADIPLRLAYCRENPYLLLTDWLRDPEPDTCIRHEVRRQLDLVAAVGATTQDDRMSLRTSGEAVTRVDRLLSERLDRTQPWIVIHPGATAASRRYPGDAFAAVAGTLASAFRCQILFSGTEQERELVESIRAMMRAPSATVAGMLTVEEMAALLCHAPLLLSNNTGPVHLASAVGTPVVDLYALTNPQHTPWLVPQRVLFQDVACRFCYQSTCPEGHHQCLRAVTPDAVVNAVIELLEETRGVSLAQRGFCRSAPMPDQGEDGDISSRPGQLGSR